MGLVEIVNPNGRKGLVPATSKAAQVYPQSPSTRESDSLAGSTTTAPGPTPPAVEPPNRNASRQDWVDFALTQGATFDAVTDLTRDQLADTYDTPTDSTDGQDA